MKTVYCIKDENNKVIYIGQTKNFQRRKWEHVYRKHIPKTYSFEILEMCNDNEAVIKEAYYIKQYNTIENGLNIVCGNGQSGIYGSGFGGRFQKGNDVWSKRKPKRVKCLETGIVYNSVKECADALNIKHSHKIYDVCNGYAKTHHKYHFEYAE